MNMTLCMLLLGETDLQMIGLMIWCMYVYVMLLCLWCNQG